MIQRFEYVWELSWNVLKDFLEREGVVLARITPAEVLKAAIAAKLIEPGEVWMRALDTRNKMAHTYDQTRSEIAYQQIAEEYYPALERLYNEFLQRAEGIEGHQP